MKMRIKDQNRRLGRPIVTSWPHAKLRPVPMKGYIVSGLLSKSGREHRMRFVTWLNENYGILPRTSGTDWDGINRWARSGYFDSWLDHNGGISGLLKKSGLSHVSAKRASKMFDSIQTSQGPWRLRGPRSPPHPAGREFLVADSPVPKPPYLEFAKTLRDVCDRFIATYDRA